MQTTQRMANHVRNHPMDFRSGGARPRGLGSGGWLRLCKPPSGWEFTVQNAHWIGAKVAVTGRIVR
jgi:hypothetical protein